MRIKNWALLAFTLPLTAFGQLDHNTLTVTSSSTISLQPDQVTFFIYADFEPTATLDDVLAAVQNVGITAANLSSVYSTNVGFPQTTEWFFVLPVPFSKLGSTLSALATLHQSIGKTLSRSLNYSVSGTQVSTQLRASAACPYAALFQDAGSQARALAAAAGVMLGPVVAISDGTNVNPSYSAQVPTQAIVIGDFLVGTVVERQVTGVPGFLAVGVPPSSQTTCTMSVQFTFLR
jgi:hypothetical protein